MFKTKDDLSIHVTRGDIGILVITANVEGEQDQEKQLYQFKPGDIIRFGVYEAKNFNVCVLQKDVIVTEHTEEVELFLTGDDTKIGDIINKAVNYWYEIQLNPDTDPQTIIGYDDIGPKIFKLYPEGGDMDG